MRRHLRQDILSHLHEEYKMAERNFRRLVKKAKARQGAETRKAMQDFKGQHFWDTWRQLYNGKANVSLVQLQLTTKELITTLESMARHLFAHLCLDPGHNDIEEVMGGSVQRDKR